MTKVAINGFGRIGRLVFRGLLDRTDLDIVAINNPSGPETAAYLLKYDTVHGRLNKKVEIDKDDLIVDGKRIHVFQDRNPENLDWSAYGTEIVIESTGKLKDRESAGKHIRGTVKKVIITAPGKDEDATIVVGVNENIYDPAKDDIISNASCTTNCLAPLAMVVNDAFGIEQGLMTTVHSTTATQRTVDGPSLKDWRGGRSASQNIIPSSTGAAKAVGKVIPSLNGKLTGMSFRVPTADVSVVDLTCTLVKSATYADICEAIKEAVAGPMKGVMDYTSDAVVSSDFLGNTHTSIFDEKAGIALTDHFVKLVSWYDNEIGYSNKVLELICSMEKSGK